MSDIVYQSIKPWMTACKLRTHSTPAKPLPMTVTLRIWISVIVHVQYTCTMYQHYFLEKLSAVLQFTELSLIVSISMRKRFV